MAARDSASSAPTVTAGVTLGLTGRYTRQAAQAYAGLRLWSQEAGVALTIRDDHGQRARALAGYGQFVDAGLDVLLGPYGSDLVREVAPAVCDAGRLLWNHGGASDDLARPGLATVVAPASAYLSGPLRLARRLGAAAAVVVHGRGRFARQVAHGALVAAGDAGIDVQCLTHDQWRPERCSSHTAIMAAGSFEEDVRLVTGVKDAPVQPVLLACVAAGIAAFGAELGWRSEGVMGPAQWFAGDLAASEESPEVGPARAVFVQRFDRQFGQEPDYPAAQAVAAGALAVEAMRRHLSGDAVRTWRTTTLLGRFGLDRSWKQTALEPVTVRWRGGTREHVQV